MLTNVTTTNAAPAPAPSPPSDDRPFVTVPLVGKHGQGRSMTIDAEDWTKVRETWGSDWTLIPNGQGRDYVSSSRHALRDLADQPGSGDTTRLSRLLMGALRGEVVTFIDGNPLNLRRSNLRLLVGTNATDWRRAQTTRVADRLMH